MKNQFTFDKKTVYNNPPDPYFVDDPTSQHFPPENYGRGPIYVDKDEKFRERYLDKPPL